MKIERRGRGSKGRPPKPRKEVEKDLLEEVQRLQAEHEYLKNCKSWFWKTSEASAKDAGSSGTEAKTCIEASSIHRSTGSCNILLICMAAIWLAIPFQNILFLVW